MTKRMIPLHQRLNTPKPKIEPYDPKQSLANILEPYGYLKGIIKNYE